MFLRIDSLERFRRIIELERTSERARASRAGSYRNLSPSLPISRSFVSSARRDVRKLALSTARSVIRGDTTGVTPPLARSSQDEYGHGRPRRRAPRTQFD